MVNEVGKKSAQVKEDDLNLLYAIEFLYKVISEFSKMINTYTGSQQPFGIAKVNLPVH